MTQSHALAQESHWEESGCKEQQSHGVSLGTGPMCDSGVERAKTGELRKAPSARYCACALVQSGGIPM